MTPPVRTSFLFIVAAGAAILAVLALVSIPLLALAQDVAGTLNAIDTPEEAVKTVVRVIGTWRTVSFMVALGALSQVGLWALRKYPPLRAALEKRGLLTVVGGLCGAIGAACVAWTANQKERVPEAAASGFIMGASIAYSPAPKVALPTDAEVIAARVAVPPGTKPGPV